MASLIVASGKQEGDYYPLGHRTNVVGRDEALPIQILDNMVSRKHLQIHYDAGTERYYAFDMKSRNGVYVNNEKLEGERALAEGDVILVGLTILLFTEKDISDRDSALLHYKKTGERMRVTVYGPEDFERWQTIQGPTGRAETGAPIRS